MYIYIYIYVYIYTPTYTCMYTHECIYNLVPIVTVGFRTFCY